MVSRLVPAASRADAKSRSVAIRMNVPVACRRYGRMLMARLLLVRHGQSEWNAVGRWQGQADPPLTELGRAQARAAARAIGELDAVFSSDLRRARETAEVIAECIGVGPVISDAGLRE